MPGSFDLRGAGSGLRVCGELPVGGASCAAEAREAAAAGDPSGGDAGGGSGAARLVRGSDSDRDEAAEVGVVVRGEPSEDQTQLSWHTASVRAVWGRSAVVRIDNLKTGVSTAVERVVCGVCADVSFRGGRLPAGEGVGQREGERAVRTLRESFGEFCGRGSRSWAGSGRAIPVAGSAALRFREAWRRSARIAAVASAELSDRVG